MQIAPSSVGHHRSVLVFGMPRSGTTWVGKIFDSHPTTLYRHEPDSYERLPLAIAPPASLSAADTAFLPGFLTQLYNNQPVSVSGKLPIFPKAYQSALQIRSRRVLIYLAKAFARGGVELRVPDGIKRNKREGVVLVWKSIESLGRLGAMLRSLSRATAVHLVRHPCGQIASVLRGEASGKFTSECAASEDYGIFERFRATRCFQRYALTLAGLRKMSPEQRLAWRWVLFNEKALDNCRDQPGYKLVRYEDICEDPTGMVKEIFEHCGLDYPAQTEAFLSPSPGGTDRGYFSIDKDSVKAAQKWRHELTQDQIEAIMAVVSQTKLQDLYPHEERRVARTNPG